MNAPADSYPLRFAVDYPDRPLNRLTTIFRLFTVIPIFIVLASIDNGASWSWNWVDSATWYWDRWDYDETPSFSTTISGMIFIPAVLMLLFRRKYPRW